MATFVLVHGGLHGSWCWESVIDRLRDGGHQVEAIDFPGRPHGPSASTIDMASYVDAITPAIDRADEPVVLVAHSLGGVAASLAAESRASEITRLFFVNALLLNDGEHALEVVLRGGPDSVLAREGAIVPSADGDGMILDSHTTAIEAFYNRCDPVVAASAAARLVPEPLKPLLEPIRLTADRFGAIRKTYIGARHDHALPWELQQSMSGAYSADFVELAGDHSPFLSAADDLLTVLTSR